MISHKIQFRKHEGEIAFFSQMEGLFQNLGTYSEIPGTTIQEGVSDFIFHSVTRIEKCFHKNHKKFYKIFLLIIHFEPFEATVLNAFAIEKERELVLEEFKLNRLEALVDFLHNLLLGKN